MLVIDPAIASPRKITVFTEDKETRWFLNELIPEYIKRLIELPDMTWGCQELATLNNDTYPAMKNILFVLDGDFDATNNPKFNVITLPGNNYPEAMIYNYLKSLPHTHPLLNNNASLNKHYSYPRQLSRRLNHSPTRSVAMYLLSTILFSAGHALKR